MKNSLIKLHIRDNVMITSRSLVCGEVIIIEDKPCKILEEIKPYFKVASDRIVKGDPIIKYGMTIGHALSDIRVGELVHVHNVVSGYTISFTGLDKKR